MVKGTASSAIHSIFCLPETVGSVLISTALAPAAAITEKPTPGEPSIKISPRFFSSTSPVEYFSVPDLSRYWPYRYSRATVRPTQSIRPGWSPLLFPVPPCRRQHLWSQLQLLINDNHVSLTTPEFRYYTPEFLQFPWFQCKDTLVWHLQSRNLNKSYPALFPTF
jgi:hypothetical protein